MATKKKQASAVVDPKPEDLVAALAAKHSELEAEKDEALRKLAGAVLDCEIDEAAPVFIKASKRLIDLTNKMRQVGIGSAPLRFDIYDRLSAHTARRLRALQHDRPDEFRLTGPFSWDPLIEKLRPAPQPEPEPYVDPLDDVL